MKEELKFICEDFKIKAKRAIEKREELMHLESDSSEYRIQLEVLNKIVKELGKYGEIIYTAILSYNNASDTFTSITKDDVLHLQLVQDEVTSMLKEIGINLNYIHPKDKNDSKR